MCQPKPWANEDSGGFFAVSLTRRPRGTASRASASSLCTALAQAHGWVSVLTDAGHEREATYHRRCRASPWRTSQDHRRELTFVLPDPRTQRLHLLHAYTYCNAAEETDGKANQLSVRHCNLRLLHSLHTSFAPARPRHHERPTFIGFLRLANGLE
jgi:hypothetical protein